MMIRKEKMIRAFLYFGTFVLLSTLTCVESKVTEEHLLACLMDTGNINQEMADLLRITCGLELSQAMKTLQEFEVVSSKKEELQAGDGLSTLQMLDNVKSFCPEIKQILLDCLQEKRLIFPIKEEDIKYNSIRRKLIQTSDEEHARSTQNLSSPSSETSLSDNSELISVFPGLNVSDSSLKSDGNSSSSFSDMASNKQQTGSDGSMIVVVVATVSVIFVLALLLCCCRGTGYGHSKNDERPLLSLSLSDYSAESSQKPFNLGSLTDEENVTTHEKTAHNSRSGKSYELHSLSNPRIEIPIETNSVETSGTSSAPGLPPLKLPPGRMMDPPNHQPATAAPPPPPPAAPAPPPPPIPKPSSGGPRPPPPVGPPPPPPPARGGVKAGPRPPPAPGARPPGPPPMGLRPPRTAAHGPNTNSSTSNKAEALDEEDSNASKAKLKPFFWDKVNANPDDSMVWNQIKSGSFQFNEEMIESLFGYAAPGKTKNTGKKECSSKDTPQHIQLIDPKKAQNLSIMLKALNVTTEEVCDALDEGNELPTELIQTLLKMAPTTDEELKLRLYSGGLSQLGPAERFLKVLVDIPFAFKRLESLLFMCTLEEEASTLKESFLILEAACNELRKSRLFLKLLEAVLKTGNRMNNGTFRGGAQAFKLDTLLKLSDVKGIDGKTTLLHFVVQEIIRSEGVRAARAAKEMKSMSSFKSEDLNEYLTQESDEILRSLGLQVVSGLSNELENVKKAAVLDSDNITGTVAKLGHSLIKASDFLNVGMKDIPEENGFHQSLKGFLMSAENDIMSLLEEEKRISTLIKNTADYFHGSSGKDEGLRLFVIVRDFLIILDKVCREVKNAPLKTSRSASKETSASIPAGLPKANSNNSIDPRQKLFPAIAERRKESSGSSSSSDND